MKRHSVAPVAFAVVLAACSGGGSSSGGGSGGSGGGGGGTPPATTFSVAAGGPMIARILFDSNANGSFIDPTDVAATTTDDGRFGRDVAGLPSLQSVGTVPASPAARLSANGIDLDSGLFFAQMRAPAGASVISPITALIDAHGNAVTVRRALGLDIGSDPIAASVNLISFDAARNRTSIDAVVARDAGRLVATNLRLLAMAAMLEDTTDPVDANVELVAGSGHMAQLISETGTLDLASASTMRALLLKTRRRFAFPANESTIDALASLMARYNAAVPVRLATPAEARGWAYAFRFFVMPELRRLEFGSSRAAITRIAAISQTDIAAAATQLAGLPAPAPGAYMAVPDYVELNSTDVFAAFLRRCDTALSLPHCNDNSPLLGIFGANTIAVDRGANRTLFAALGALADEGREGLSLAPLGGFLGLTSLSYTSRSNRGDEATGTIIVRVRAPD